MSKIMSSLCGPNFNPAPSSMPKLLSIIHFPHVNPLVPGLKLLEKMKKAIHAKQPGLKKIFMDWPRNFQTLLRKKASYDSKIPHSFITVVMVPPSWISGLHYFLLQSPR